MRSNCDRATQSKSLWYTECGIRIHAVCHLGLLSPPHLPTGLPPPRAIRNSSCTLGRVLSRTRQFSTSSPASLFNVMSVLTRLKCHLFLQARNLSHGPAPPSHEDPMPQLSRHREDLSCSSVLHLYSSPIENLNRRQWLAILSRHQKG